MSSFRNTSISVPACFEPWIRIDNIRYFLLWHNHVERLYEDDWPCDVHGPIFTKWAHSICTQNKPYISTLWSKWFILKIKKISLSSICMVSNLLIIFYTLFRMPTYKFRIPRVGEHTFQMIDYRKVPHHQGMNLSLLVVLLIRIIFIINTLSTDSSILLILFLNSVNIHMIVTSVVSHHVLSILCNFSWNLSWSSVIQPL
jgi:hypothetical protein